PNDTSPRGARIEGVVAVTVRAGCVLIHACWRPGTRSSRSAAIAVGQARRYQLDADRLRALGLRRVRVDVRRDAEGDGVVLESRVGEVTRSVGAHAAGGLEVVSLIGRSDRLTRDLAAVLMRQRSGRQGSGRNIGRTGRRRDRRRAAKLAVADAPGVGAIR